MASTGWDNSDQWGDRKDDLGHTASLGLVPEMKTPSCAMTHAHLPASREKLFPLFPGPSYSSHTVPPPSFNPGHWLCFRYTPPPMLTPQRDSLQLYYSAAWFLSPCLVSILTLLLSKEIFYFFPLGTMSPPSRYSPREQR